MKFLSQHLDLLHVRFRSIFLTVHVGLLIGALIGVLVGILVGVLFAGCTPVTDSAPSDLPPTDLPPSDDDSHETGNLYFPPIGSNEWATIELDDLGWRETAADSLLLYLDQHNTRAFILLKNGRIVFEHYHGTEYTTNQPFTAESLWYWASAGKAITAVLAGIAQDDGVLDIYATTATYLGRAWSSLTPEQEDQIQVVHQLSMTTGLDYTTGDLNCTEPECLRYKADAGTQWYYHNAPYTLLTEVIERATGDGYNLYTQKKLRNTTGMGGQWLLLDGNRTYFSTARDMARFGLMVLNSGRWENTAILKDSLYVQQMTQSSQELNLSYGYLWWLNGKSSIILPGRSDTYLTPLAPDAPETLFAALGKNGQLLAVEPEEGLVMVRMGDPPDSNLAPIAFHNALWVRIQRLFKE